MSSLDSRLIRLGLDAISLSGTHHAARALLGGVGAILMFHRVCPPPPGQFRPNAGLEITPEFLNALITHLRKSNIDIVSLPEAADRLSSGAFDRRFVVLTFDDGYRDNREFAYPVLRSHGAPFTIFVASDFAAGCGDLWWVSLERAISKLSVVPFRFGKQVDSLPARNDQEKLAAWKKIYWTLRETRDENILRSAVRFIADSAEIDGDSICKELCLGWDELREFAKDPLVTLGGHTRSHLMLNQALPKTVRRELEDGAADMHTHLGQRPELLAYPVGAAGPREFDLAGKTGYKVAVTTRLGVLQPAHSKGLLSLPRISVNGNFQRIRYVEALLSGLPSAVLEWVKPGALAA